MNPNKHIHNNQDGGRRRKLRHVSKIDNFVRGKDAIKSYCKDLFNVKNRSEAVCVPKHDQSFSQILEEHNEESPPKRADLSMQSASQTSPCTFRIQTS